MAANVLTYQETVAASQTGETLIDPTSSFGLIIDQVILAPDSDIAFHLFHGSVSASTKIAEFNRGCLSMDFRDHKGNGLRLPKGAILKATNGADAVEITVHYHLDANAL